MHVTDVRLVTARNLEEIAFFIAMCMTAVSTLIFFDVLLFTFSAKQNIFVCFFSSFLEKFTVSFNQTAEDIFFLSWLQQESSCYPVLHRLLPFS